MLTHNITKILNKNILIVGDNIDEVKLLQQILAPDIGNCLKAVNTTMAIKLFQQHDPLLIILAFEQIDDAALFSQSLYDYDNEDNIDALQTLLCCKAEQAEQAFSLCTRGLPNDFVIYRPLYDIYSLRIKVMKGLDNCIKTNHVKKLEAKINKVNDEIIQLHKLLTQNLSTNTNQQKQNVDKLKLFTKKLTNKLDTFNDKLTELDVEQISPPAKTNLIQLLADVKDKDFKRGSEELLHSMTTTSQWLSTFTDNVDQCFNSIKAEQKKINIMLIDDDEMYGCMVTDILMQTDTEITLVNNGKSALEKLTTLTPDIILLDQNMPDLTGLETLKKIKANEKTKLIPVVMLTGEATRELIKQCLICGATGYIIKPSNREVIQAKIQEVLQLSTKK